MDDVKRFFSGIVSKGIDLSARPLHGFAQMIMR